MTCWNSVHGALLLLFSTILCSDTCRVTAQAPFVSHLNTHNEKERALKYSNDEKDAPAAVNISKFQLDLDGSFPAFVTPREMVERVEDFLTLYIGVKALKEGMTLETLELAAPCFRKRRTSQRRLQETMTMSVYIHGGVAFFSSGSYPSERELHDAIELGLETEFPAYLERIDSSITVEDITYIGTTFAPTPAPDPASIPGGIQATEASTDDGKKRGIIAAGATGAFLGILIVAAALLVRRHRDGPSLDDYLERTNHEHSKESHTHIQSSIHDEELSGGEVVNKSSSSETNNTTCPGGMENDDSSQWTLSTYPEDANTVMTFGTGKSIASARGGGSLNDRTESFERDRQISLKKDMLTTTPAWNSNVDTSDIPVRKVDDTVLIPSHFVPAEEDIALPHPPPPPSNNTTISTARFAANDEGEEIYLVLPPPRNEPPRVSFQQAK